MAIKNIPLTDQPRERLICYGSKALSNSEIIAIILETGTKEKTAIELANDILMLYPMDTLSSLTLEELKKIKGVKNAKALKIIAAVELGNRLRYKKISNVNLSNPDAVYNMYKDMLAYLDYEKLIAIYLDSKCRYIDAKEISTGTVNKSYAYPSVVFRWALKLNSAGFILLHNHPSGDSTPSKSDIDLTQKLINVGLSIEIPLLDHLIITDNGYQSVLNSIK